MNTRENIIVGLNDSIEILNSLAQEGGRYTAIEEEELLESVQAFLQDAIGFVKEIDVTPEELERLKKCRHECKIDCLLEHYERIKDERDALLKARLPRVLKLEELLSICEEPVWLEPKSGKSYTGWVLIDNTREGAGGTDIKLCMTRPGRVMVCPNIDLYGIKWRCWTSRPTTEQMEAEPWATKQR